MLTGDFQTYQAYTNSDADISSYGASLGLSAKVLGNYDLSGSYTYTKLEFDRVANPDFQVGFNTPEHQFKASFGNEALFKNFGFNKTAQARLSIPFLTPKTYIPGLYN